MTMPQDLDGHVGSPTDKAGPVGWASRDDCMIAHEPTAQILRPSGIRRCQRRSPVQLAAPKQHSGKIEAATAASYHKSKIVAPNHAPASSFRFAMFDLTEPMKPAAAYVHMGRDTKVRCT